MSPDPWAVVPSVRRRYALRFVAALVVVLAVIGVFGGVIYAHAGSELQADIEQQLIADAETGGDRLDTWFQSTERYVESLSRSTAFRNDDRFVIADSLHRTADRPAFEGAYYVNVETGSVDAAAGTNEISDGTRVSDVVDEQLTTATDGAALTGFSEPFETEDGRPAMLVASEIPGDSDHAAVGLVDLESLSGYVIGADETNEVTVVDGDGTVVLAENRTRLLETGAFESDGFGDVPGVSTVDPDDAEDEVILGYTPVDGTDWTLTTSVPTAEAYSLQSDVSTQILAMVAVTFASLLVLGATVGRNTARSLRHLSERATAIEHGNLSEPVESGRCDELGELHRSLDRMRRSLRDRLEEANDARREAERERERAETAREEAEAAQAESKAFSRHLERTANTYGKQMRACAEGDLTRRLEPDTESEAMAEIAAEFNAMMDDLETTVATTREFAAAVDDAAESTADGVVEARTAAERVATSVEEIADGADRQTEHLVSVGAEVDDLSSTTTEIADSASTVAALAKRTATTSTAARESAQRAIDGMRAIADDADDAVAEVDRLEAEIEAIDDLLAFIREIADQTSMLALNANIEAARSSSGAAGFATVAEEIKSLSEETQKAATDVEEHLERVKDQSERVATVVRQTDERIADNRSAVEASVSSLEEISAAAAETNEGVQRISAATQQQAAATREVATEVDDVTAIAEETSAETEAVAATAQEQTGSLQTVSRMATSLSERADELSATLSSFTVSTEDRTGVDRPMGVPGDDERKRDDGSDDGDRGATSDAVPGEPGQNPVGSQ